MFESEEWNSKRRTMFRWSEGHDRFGHIERWIEHFLRISTTFQTFANQRSYERASERFRNGARAPVWDPKTPLFKRKAPKTGSRCSKSQRGLPTKSFKNPRISRICTEYKNNLESNLHRLPEQRLVNIRPNIRPENSLFGLDLRDQSKANQSENSPFGLDLRDQSKANWAPKPSISDQFSEICAPFPHCTEAFLWTETCFLLAHRPWPKIIKCV